MKIAILAAMCFIISIGVAQAQHYAIPPYYRQNDFLMAASSVYYDGLLGFTNPANLSFLKAGEARYYWSTDDRNAGSFNNWGLFIAAPHIGFGMLRRHLGDLKTTDYRLSLGLGNDRASLGIGYGWSAANIENQESDRIFSSGLIVRPMKYLSVGLIGDFSFQSEAAQGVAEVGVRPLGDSRLTVFGDFAMQNKTEFNDAPWSAGAVYEIVPGVNLAGRYFENETFTAGLLINFGCESISNQFHFNDDQVHEYNSYSVRLGGFRPSFMPGLIDKGKRYLKINLTGSVGYLNYEYFNTDTHRFLDLLNNIKAAGDDKRISAIAMYVSNTSIAPELAWEIREALKDAQRKGKKVVAFIEYTDIKTYFLASVADVVVIDPTTLVAITGYAMGKTYLKGTLEKLGLGFDEWRFFKYKSAMEVFSRTNFSQPDSEQYQAYIDDWYANTKQGVCESRRMTPERFDSLINDVALFTPVQALEYGLADTIARWEDVDAVIDKLADAPLRPIGADQLFANALPPKYWGGDPEIAVVYALGECAMYTGIKAVWLEKQLRRLAADNSIKAVVFRVDSPGGDGLASDIVAEALKKCAEKKPVIVSQGQVAGSGGYWISMYGDKILAGPNTITGSIGVIGGWLWDDGFSKKLGLTSDYVTAGKHADVGYGVQLPILGIMVPARDLTSEERDKVKAMILSFYDDFVAKVAMGRHMTVDRVREIAQGHFYSGVDGQEIGLVDDVGGLMLAIEMAKQDAGIAADQRVTLVEIPQNLGLFPIRKPFNMIDLGQKIDTEDPAIQYIKMLNESPIKAIPMLPPGSYPAAQ